jgi:GNAT superfamily N-acetyltransferase
MSNPDRRNFAKHGTFGKQPLSGVPLHPTGSEPHHRRRGVGSALLNAVRISGSHLGITLLTLDVWSFNEGARAFFQRHGLEKYIERLWWKPYATDVE